jgi:hypothetical protein
MEFASVIVTTAGHFTYELLERVYSRRVGQPVTGIVVAQNEASLHRQVILRSAAARLCGPLRHSRIDIMPPLSAKRERGVKVLGNHAGASEVRKAFEAGAGLLNIVTHSDGVDAYFGDVTLCSVGAMTLDGVDGVPRCVARGVCHRHHVTIKQALDANYLMRPIEAAARLIVFHTCRGALAAEALVNPAWGLITGFLDNPRIGAVATTWEMNLLDREDPGRAARPLQRGTVVGQALGEFLDLPAVRARNVRMCLFGDPRLRLPANSAAPRKNERRRWEVGAHLFLQQFLKLQKAQAAADLQPLVLKAGRALSRYLKGRKSGEQTSAEAGRELREALMDVICDKGCATDWQRFAKLERTFSPPFGCPQCGARTQTWIMRIVAQANSRRRVVNCPRCGTIDESPAEYPDLAVWLDQKVLHLRGSLPDGEWSARLLIDPGTEKGESPARRWMAWPAEKDGTPARSIEIGDALEGWPMNLTLVLIHGLCIIAITCNARA